jgi:hypothetical protein
MVLNAASVLRHKCRQNPIVRHELDNLIGLAISKFAVRNIPIGKFDGDLASIFKNNPERGNSV